MKLRSLLVPSLFLAAGCGGNVVVDGASNGTGGGTTTGTITSTVTSTVTTTMTTGTTAVSCHGAVVSILVDGAPRDLTSSCASATWNPTQSSVPIAYLISGGGGPPQGFQLDACAGPGAGAEGVTIELKGWLGPDMYSGVGLTYTDPTGAIWDVVGTTANLEIIQSGAVGDLIVGDFSGVVVDESGAAMHKISGKFYLCRVPDEVLP